MKILCIGDPHFMLSNLDQIKEYTKKIVSIIKKDRPDIVVVLGDLFHTHEKKHILVEKEVTYFLKYLVKYSEIYLIVGNHDMINSQQFLTQNHAFTPYKNWESLTVCDRVKAVEIKGKTFVFVPFTPPGRFIEALDTYPEWRSADCIFAHQEIRGCRFNPTMVSEDGDIWEDDYPMLISGHIHDEQWVGNNVYYPGSSMQHGFSENCEKTIAMAEITDDTDMDITRYNLGLRKKRIVYIDIEDINSENTKEKLEKYTDDDIKLVIKGTPEEIKTLRKGSDYKTMSDNQNMKISFLTKDIDVRRDSRKKSLLEILKDLVDDEPENVKDALKILLEK